MLLSFWFHTQSIHTHQLVRHSKRNLEKNCMCPWQYEGFEKQRNPFSLLMQRILNQSRLDLSGMARQRQRVLDKHPANHLPGKKACVTSGEVTAMQSTTVPTCHSGSSVWVESLRQEDVGGGTNVFRTWRSKPVKTQPKTAMLPQGAQQHGRQFQNNFLKIEQSHP